LKPPREKAKDSPEATLSERVSTRSPEILIEQVMLVYYGDLHTASGSPGIPICEGTDM